MFTLHFHTSACSEVHLEQMNLRYFYWNVGVREDVFTWCLKPAPIETVSVIPAYHRYATAEIQNHSLDLIFYARTQPVQCQAVSNGTSAIATSTRNEWNKRVKVSYVSTHSGPCRGCGIIKENDTFKAWWNHLPALTFDALCSSRITPSWALPFTKHRNQERFTADTTSASGVKLQLTWRVPHSL